MLLQFSQSSDLKKMKRAAVSGWLIGASLTWLPFSAEGQKSPSHILPVFSPAPGFYQQGQNISIQSPVKGQIIYTLDGSVPERGNAFIYSNPFRLDTTRVIRA